MNLRKKCWLVTEKTWKDGWLGTENLCWLDTEKTIGMKDNYLRHYQMLKIQWLTRYGKFEGMIDSARKNLKGWLTRHGKFKGMVDSARKTCVDSARKIWRDGWLAPVTFLIKYNEKVVDSVRKILKIFYIWLTIQTTIIESRCLPHESWIANVL